MQKTRIWDKLEVILLFRAGAILRVPVIKLYGKLDAPRFCT